MKTNVLKLFGGLFFADFDAFRHRVCHHGTAAYDDHT